MTAPWVAGPGWYADPLGKFDQRYWDGFQWTPEVMTHGAVEADPNFVPDSSISASMGTVAVNAPIDNPYTDIRGPTTPPEWVVGPSFSYHTSLSPSGAQQALLQVFPSYGIIVTSAVPGRIDAIVGTGKEINMLLCVVLFLMCVIFGIIYLLLRRQKKEALQLTIIFIGDAAGTTATAYGPHSVLNVARNALVVLPA